jgi:predicted transcriptional regulator
MTDEFGPVREQLREVMSSSGFTQVDVAKTIGVSQSVLSRFLRGESTTPDTLHRIRAFLGADEHPNVITHEDVRRAVRLYRFVKDLLGKGSQLVVRDPDGTERIIIPLW